MVDRTYASIGRVVNRAGKGPARDSAPAAFAGVSIVSRHIKQLFIFFIIQFALQGCAFGRPTMIHHSFSFSTLRDSPGVEVLNYRYGDCKEFGTCANKYRVAEGKTFTGGRVAGWYPRGEYLYVKWRIRETGQVYEDKADLTKRLPSDISDCRIHFALKGAQLYIWLMPPPGTWPVSLKNPISESKSAYLRKY